MLVVLVVWFFLKHVQKYVSNLCSLVHLNEKHKFVSLTRLSRLTFSGIFPANLSTGGPSFEDSGREGQRMGIPVSILAK